MGCSNLVQDDAFLPLGGYASSLGLWIVLRHVHSLLSVQEDEISDEISELGKPFGLPDPSPGALRFPYIDKHLGER